MNNKFTTPSDRAWQATYREHGLNIDLSLPDGVQSLPDFLSVILVVMPSSLF